MQISEAGPGSDSQPRAAALDAHTLAGFVESHYPRLVGLAGLICGGQVEPADVVQSALEHAWRQRRDLREVTRLRPWLDRIVVRQAIRMRRHRFRFLATSERREGQELEIRATPGVEPHEWTQLRIAFAELSREQRAVVALHLYAGYSVEDTAAITGAGVETTRSRLRLARQRLRREMIEADR